MCRLHGGHGFEGFWPGCRFLILFLICFSVFRFRLGYVCHQEREEGLRREQDNLSRAKDRLERERAKAVQDQNVELRAALRRAEAAR